MAGVAGLVAGLHVHPIVIGRVLAAVVNAVLVRRNFGRVEQVNAGFLAVVPADV